MGGAAQGLATLVNALTVNKRVESPPGTDRSHRRVGARARYDAVIEVRFRRVGPARPFEPVALEITADPVDERRISIHHHVLLRKTLQKPGCGDAAMNDSKAGILQV